MATKNLTASTFRLQPGDRYLKTKEVEDQYGISRSLQCRLRKTGEGPAFILRGSIILYPEQSVLAWLSNRLVTNSAQLPAERHGSRYKHLPAARQKAQELRRERAQQERNETVSHQ